MKSVKVQDYMTRRVLSFSPEENIIAALRKLLKVGHSGGPVLDADGNLVGMLSEIDCLKEALQGGYYQEAGDRVCDHMTAEVDKVNADDEILSTADFFLEGRRRLAVVEDSKLVGLITRQDFAKALIETIDNPRHGS